MLIDGITLAAGSGLSIMMLDDARRGPEFPQSADVTDLWELTEAAGDNTTGIYEFTTTGWVLRNPSRSLLSYDISGTVFGKPEANARVMFFVSPQTFYIQGSLAGALARALQAPTVRQDFPINILRGNTLVPVGIMRFEENTELGVFVPNSSEPLRVLRGDTIVVLAPDVVDELIADISFTLCGHISV